MSNDPKSVFDPKAFLAAVGAGVSFTKWNKGQVIFSQGDPADALFYIQKGKVKVTTLAAMKLGAVDFFEKPFDGDARFAMGSDSVDRGEDRLLGRNAAQLGSPGRARRRRASGRDDGRA